MSNSGRDFGRRPNDGGGPQLELSLSPLLSVPTTQWSNGGGGSKCVEGQPGGMKDWGKWWIGIGVGRLRKEGEGATFEKES